MLIGATLVIMYYDGTYESLDAYLRRGYTDVKTGTELGTIRIPVEIPQDASADPAWHVASQTAHDAAVAVKTQRGDPETEFELWSKFDPFNQVLVFRGNQILGDLPIAGPKILYHLKLVKVENGVYTISQARVPGIWGDDRPIWPNPSEATFAVRQWSDTAKEVCSYKPDYESPKARHRFGWNLDPKYPVWKLGEIPTATSPEKNYFITASVPHFERGTIQKGAYRSDSKMIAARAPLWVSPGKFEESFVHVRAGEFSSKFFPKLFNPAPSEESAAKQTFLSLAHRFIKGYELSDKTLTDVPMKKFDCYASLAVGQILMFHKKTEQFALLRIGDAEIVTFFRPEDAKKYVDGIIRRDAYRQVATD